MSRVSLSQRWQKNTRPVPSGMIVNTPRVKKGFMHIYFLTLNALHNQHRYYSGSKLCICVWFMQLLTEQYPSWCYPEPEPPVSLFELISPLCSIPFDSCCFRAFRSVCFCFFSFTICSTDRTYSGRSLLKRFLYKDSMKSGRGSFQGSCL